MKEQDFASWTCQELIKYVYHELNQKSAIALSFLQVLLDEDNFGFVNDEQQKMLSQLQEEIQTIHTVADEMRIWRSINQK